jgi:hypothetical protein
MQTTTLDMEIALMKYCDVRQNIVVPNVSYGISRLVNENGISTWDVLHECDILRVTKTGFGVEYEIKISKYDFLKDLKKKHSHNSRFIKQLFFAVPLEMLEFAKQHLPENAGLVYLKNDKIKIAVDAPIRKNCFKWSDKEMFKLARLGTMRIFTLKKLINKIKKDDTNLG